jgi:hypothetical protein
MKYLAYVYMGDIMARFQHKTVCEQYTKTFKLHVIE